MKMNEHLNGVLPEGTRALIREALRSGTIAGLAMVPFAAVFRVFGLRINEYGKKTLALVVGDVAPPAHYVLSFAQHLLISWLVAVPLILLLDRLDDRRARVLAGAGYGAAFYAAVNALALPIAFGDPTPWELGFDTIYPSLLVHLVYGTALGLTVRSVKPVRTAAGATPRPP